jgi:hypothetical protein
MALDASAEANTVTHWGIVTQGCGELRKFTKELDIELHPMCMTGQKLKILDLLLCDFTLECLLFLFRVMIISLFIVLLVDGGQTRHLKAQGEFVNVLVLELFSHHPVLLNIVTREV